MTRLEKCPDNDVYKAVMNGKPHESGIDKAVHMFRSLLLDGSEFEIWIRSIFRKTMTPVLQHLKDKRLNMRVYGQNSYGGRGRAGLEDVVVVGKGVTVKDV